ncbi:hypothetical protein LSAT2_003678 [Lamellibrachia satsuma]|nr:hypothetical protein LSAT2_003678 [Lamellibrachia satsuma]
MAWVHTRIKPDSTRYYGIPDDAWTEHLHKENRYYLDVLKKQCGYNELNKEIAPRRPLPRFPPVVPPPRHCPTGTDRFLRIQYDCLPSVAPGVAPQHYRYPLTTSRNYGWMVMYKDLNPPSPYGRRDIFKVFGWPVPT